MATQPTDLDILCGKSKMCIRHPGSRRFREVIESFVDRYQQAPTKYDKMTVTKTVHDTIKKSSRFLKFDEATGMWEELNGLQARDKIGHSLRFACRANRKRKTKKSGHHKRVRSSSSYSSASTQSTASETECSNFSSSSYSQDSILELFQRPMVSASMGNYKNPPPALQALSPQFSCFYSEDKEQDGNFDDLMMLLREDEEQEQPTEDHMKDYMNDIVEVVKSLGFEETRDYAARNNHHADESPDNLMSLLQEPFVGEF